MSRYGRILTWVLLLLSCITLLNYVFACFCFNVPQSSDDLTLFNPIYQFLHTGSLTYPIYEGNHIITVHPPSQYFVVAFFMSCGFSSQVAFSLPFLISLSLLLTVNFFSALSRQFKFAVVFSVQMLFMFPISSVRPDATLAILWFTSIILLEWAYRAKSNSYLYFGGAVLGALSAVWHYYGIFGLIGMVFYLPIYNLNAVRVTQWRPMVAGVFVVLAPFFLGFVIPNLNEILTHVNLNQGEGNLFTAWERHFVYYPSLGAFADYSWFSLPILLLHLCYVNGLALTLAVMFFMFVDRSIRRVILSSSTLLLAILFFSRGKSEGYLIPEHLIFLFSSSYVCCCLITALVVRSNIAYTVWGWLIGCFCFSIVPVNFVEVLSLIRYPIEIKDHDMHEVRWCSKQLCGDSAYIGGRLSTWYISGAEKWQNIQPLLSQLNNKTDIDTFINHLTKFNYLVETRHMANTWENPQKTTLNTLYLDSSLFLKGFIFSDNNGYESELASLFYSTDNSDSVRGYVCKGSSNSFEVVNDDSGNMVFLSFKVARKAGLLDSIIHENNGIFAINYFPLPNEREYLRDNRYERNSHYLGFMLLKKESYLSSRLRLEQQVKVRDVIVCKQIVSKSYTRVVRNKDEQPIKYVR